MSVTACVMLHRIFVTVGVENEKFKQRYKNILA